MPDMKLRAHEIDGPSGSESMKMQDMKMMDQLAGHEIAGQERSRIKIDYITMLQG